MHMIINKYIKSDTSLVSDSMLELIENVSNQFRKDMEFSECDTFSELVHLNDWESSDIRSEIEYMVNRMFGGSMFDDGTIISPDDSEMRYREFKKRVINSI